MFVFGGDTYISSSAILSTHMQLALKFSYNNNNNKKTKQKKRTKKKKKPTYMLIAFNYRLGEAISHKGYITLIVYKCE